MKKRRADHGKKRVNVQHERKKRIAKKAKRVAEWRAEKAKKKEESMKSE